MLKLLFLMFMFFFVAIYFLPSFVAIGRKHIHVLQITILNTFLGWSFIAWVAALIWATTNHTDRSTSTKGSWIIIGVIFLMSISPLFFYSVIPPKIKSDIMEETYYKKVIYTDNNGKITKNETESHNIKKD